MISGISGQVPSYYAPVGTRQQAPVQERSRKEELTTITTHCDKQHWHTPACPHTAVTRPADRLGGTGRYLDVLA